MDSLYIFDIFEGTGTNELAADWKELITQH